VNTWVAGQPQVLDRQDWLARLRVPDRHCGTTMTLAEAAQVSAQVDLDALRAYREAVEERTRAVVTALRAEDLDEVVDAARLQQSVSDGTYSYSGPWGSSQIQARVITSNVRDRGMGQTEHVTFVPNVRKGEWHEQRAQ
jgi:hypothetical protein